MFNSDDIYRLLNVPDVTDLVDTFPVQGTEFPAIFADETVMPEAFTGYKSINYYVNAPIDLSQPFRVYPRVANCRSTSQQESMTLAMTVADKLHREYSNGSYMLCTILQTIYEEESLYNTPVTVTMLSD